jgi:hypothetical protein
MYYWTAKNNSSFLNGYRTAKTIIGAVRAGRRYVDSELCGEGRLVIADSIDGLHCNPVRVDSKSIFTNFKWETELNP